MTSQEIRQSFLDFFRSKQHTVVPSASLMPDAPNLLFTNAGMNQFVPIFLGQRSSPFDPARATDTQKCIRAGGKHNDLEDVGWDTYHHTFFEMLGNWSFGDYFKAEAINWAWELLTEVWGFPKSRIYATVYCPDKEAGDPSEFDQEAYDLWEAKFREAGLDPKVHIVNGGKKDNFWMMGETGPCGPCSELHVDLTQDGDTGGKLVNADSSECIEIWNLVFIQFNANADGTFTDLPAKHVDTGMGFERVTSVMQNTNGFQDFGRLISNYETDVFRPLFQVLETLSGKKYRSTLPKSKEVEISDTEKVDVAFRVIADHARTLSFSMADGILPGNTDRNYVLRRILRRAVRYGRDLGLHEPFLHRLVDVLADTMGDVFPEVRRRKDQVAAGIRAEEEAFIRTLDRGIAIFEESLSSAQEGVLPGEFAFKLYDTYGFPLDLTELMAKERGLKVDTVGFKKHMKAQRERSQAAQKKEIIEVTQLDQFPRTEFTGYSSLSTVTKVIETVSVKGKLAVLTERSPFYTEMGGQITDTGVLKLGASMWRVVDTQSQDGRVLHILQGEDAPDVGVDAELIVDGSRRAAIQRHHTATHLLHWALHEVVSPEATQKGSFVGEEKLTFDFNAAALTREQIRDVERLVNERVLENGGVSVTEAPYSEINEREDITQAFGEKYGDIVRVVQIGGDSGALNGYSMELCGGTHTLATGEVGLFRIRHEAAVSAGVRRIEAVAGSSAYADTVAGFNRLDTLAGMIGCPGAELERKVEMLLARNKEIEKELKILREKQAGALAKELISNSYAVNGIQFIGQHLAGMDTASAQIVAENLKASFDGIAILAVDEDAASVALFATVGKSWTKRIQAGAIIKAVAPLVDGRGGGRPEMARGGGRSPEGIPDVIAAAEQLVAKKT